MVKTLRIAHIDTERTWRGGEQQVFSLVKGLNQKGHFNLVILRRESIFSSRLKEENINIFEIHPLGEWDVAAAYTVHKKICDESIDIIHAQTSHGAAMAALATIGTRIPIVVTRRVDFHLSRNPFSRWKYGRPKKILAISHGVKNILLSDGIPEEKIQVVPSGVDFSRFGGVTPVSHADMRVPENTFIIGQVAALEDHKDHETFFKALSLLKDDFPNVRAVLVGDGSLRSKLKDMAVALQLGPIVRFFGFQERPLDFLASFDVFCLSSKLEGLGTSIFDAMALKVPVVATNTGGIPEIVQNGVTGYLVPPRNPVQLAQALARLVQSDNRNEEMREKAFEKAMEYDIIHTIDKTEGVYQEILS